MKVTVNKGASVINRCVYIYIYILYCIYYSWNFDFLSSVLLTSNVWGPRTGKSGHNVNIWPKLRNISFIDCTQSDSLTGCAFIVRPQIKRCRQETSQWNWGNHKSPTHATFWPPPHVSATSSSLIIGTSFYLFIMLCFSSSSVAMLNSFMFSWKFRLQIFGVLGAREAEN